MEMPPPYGAQVRIGHVLGTPMRQLRAWMEQEKRDTGWKTAETSLLMCFLGPILCFERTCIDRNPAKCDTYHTFCIFCRSKPYDKYPTFEAYLRMLLDASGDMLKAFLSYLLPSGV